MSGKRAKYTQEMKRIVREKYPLCQTLEDKQELAESLGMDSIHKLYNLASRLKVTRSYDEWADSPFARDNNSNTMPDNPIQINPGQGRDPGRLKIRESIGETVFRPEDDRFLQKNFGSMRIEDIAFQRGHTESAMLYRARKLGLRQSVMYWDILKVQAWLNLSASEIEEFPDQGIDVFPLADRRGEVKTRLVSTTSLLRWLQRENRQNALLQERDADEFFIRELIETVKERQNGKSEWELCKFLSAGHVCQNPQAGISYGLFCTNCEKHRAGDDPKCNVKTMPIDDPRLQPKRPPQSLPMLNSLPRLND